jgi:hypothetical protein
MKKEKNNEGGIIMNYVKLPSGQVIPISVLRNAGVDEEIIMNMISATIEMEKQSSTINIETLDRFALRYSIANSMGNEFIISTDSNEQIRAKIQHILEDTHVINRINKITMTKNIDIKSLEEELIEIYDKYNLLINDDFLDFIDQCNDKVDMMKILADMEQLDIQDIFNDEELSDSFSIKADRILEDDKYSIFRKYNLSEDYLNSNRLIAIYEETKKL